MLLSREKGATPLKPILKRKAAEDSTLHSDDSAIPGSQSSRKRHKVEFNMDLEIHEIGTRTVGEIKREICKALAGHAKGDNEEYDILKEIVAGKEQYPDEEYMDNSLSDKRRQELKGYMVALASFIPQLGKSQKGLVMAVLKCQWLGRDAHFVQVYTRLLGALVSAQGTYLDLVLSTLLDKFFQSVPSCWEVPGFPSVNKAEMQVRLHKAIRYLLRIFPAASTVVTQMIVAKYPYIDEPKSPYVTYIDNLLKLGRYAPQLRTQIVSLIINRLVQVDVHMQLDLEDLDDPFTAMVVALRSSRTSAVLPDDADDDSDLESSSSDEDDEDDEADDYTRAKRVRDSVEKMDFVLDRLFELFTPRFDDPDSEEATDAYQELLENFSNQILPAYKSRHTQFLLFHFGQKSERLMDAFCGTCINIIDSQRPAISRQSASAYLASFVARGAYVPGRLVRTIFEVLGAHLERMRILYEPACRGPDVRRYGAYYSLMQALMYIFCFRWRDLILSAPDHVDIDDISSYLDQDFEWLPEVKKVMIRNINSSLNPLKVCAPIIVKQFAHLAHRFSFAYVFSLLEKNKRVSLSQYVSVAYSNGGALRESGLDSTDESSLLLDAYFPFDPYHLPKSKRWITTEYLTWQSIPGSECKKVKEGEEDNGAEEGEDDEAGENLRDSTSEASEEE